MPARRIVAIDDEVLAAAKAHREFRDGVPLLRGKPGSSPVTPKSKNRLRDGWP